MWHKQFHFWLWPQCQSWQHTVRKWQSQDLKRPAWILSPHSFSHTVQFNTYLLDIVYVCISILLQKYLCVLPHRWCSFPLFVLSTIVTLGKGVKDASLGRGRGVSLQSKEKGEPAHSSLEIRDKGAFGPGGFWKKQSGLWEAGIFPFLLCATV